MITKIILNIDNQTNHSIPQEKLYESASTVLHQTQLRGIVEIDLTVCNLSYIRKINASHRGIDEPTDVLSFPISNLFRGKPKKSFIPVPDDQPMHLGDMVLCYPYIVKQAKQQNHSFEEEFFHLFIHGLKHLIGFHHK